MERTTDSEFYYELQRSVLLSLREDGILTQTQYRYTEEMLQEQRRALIRAMIDGDSAQ